MTTPRNRDFREEAREYLLQGQYDAAVELGRQAVGHALQTEDQGLAVVAHLVIARALAESGQAPFGAYRRALDRVDKLDNPEIRCEVLLTGGDLALRFAWQPDSAESDYSEALTLATEAGYVRGSGEAWLGLARVRGAPAALNLPTFQPRGWRGWLWHLLGVDRFPVKGPNPAEAEAMRRAARQAMAVARELDDPPLESDALIEIAHSYLLEGDAEAARERVHWATPIKRRYRDLRGQSALARLEAEVALLEAQDNDAIEHLNNAITLARQGGAIIEETLAYRRLAALYLKADYHASARAVLDEWRARAAQFQVEPLEMIVLGALGQWLTVLNETGEAQATYQRVVELSRAQMHPALEADAHRALGLVALQRKKVKSARAAYDAALSLDAALKDSAKQKLMRRYLWLLRFF